MVPHPAENKESTVGKVKEESTDALETLHCKASSLVANSTEQGSTLRDLLTTTAGKLRLGSTDAGIAFAPVYSTASQVSQTRTVTQYTPRTSRVVCHKVILNLFIQRNVFHPPAANQYCNPT